MSRPLVAAPSGSSLHPSLSTNHTTSAEVCTGHRRRSTRSARAGSQSGSVSDPPCSTTTPASGCRVLIVEEQPASRTTARISRTRVSMVPPSRPSRERSRDQRLFRFFFDHRAALTFAITLARSDALIPAHRPKGRGRPLVAASSSPYYSIRAIWRASLIPSCSA
jgi:hypothetical protein